MRLLHSISHYIRISKINYYFIGKSHCYPRHIIPKQFYTTTQFTKKKYTDIFAKEKIEFHKPFKDRADRLVSHVQNSNRLNYESVFECVRSFLNEGCKEEDAALILLRSTGRYLVASFESRRDLSNQVWGAIESDSGWLDGKAKSVKFFNARLRVMLDNEQEFCPEQFLESMKVKNVLPDKITYQLLIRRFCEKGNMNSVEKLLDEMKTCNHAVPTSTYGHMMRGYIKSMDQNGPACIQQEIKGIKNTATAYTYMMLGFAERGDMYNVRRVMQKADVMNVSLNDVSVLAVVVALARCGHEQYIEEMLDRLPADSNHAVTGIETLRTLILHGRDEAAFMLFLRMRQTYTKDNFGLRFFKLMVSFDRPTEAIVKVFSDLVDGGYIEEADPSSMAMYAITLKKLPLGLNLLRDMNNRGYPLTSTHLKAYFLKCSHRDNVDDIYAGLDVLLGLNDPDKLNVAYFQAILRLYQFSEQHETVHHRLLQANYPPSYVDYLKVLWYLRKGDLNRALTCMDRQTNTLHEHEPPFHQCIYKMIRKEDIQNIQFDVLAQLIASFVQNLPKDDIRSFVRSATMSVRRVLESTKHNSNNVEMFVQSLHHCKVPLMKDFKSEIMSALPSDISAKCRMMLESQFYTEIHNTKALDNVDTISTHELNTIANYGTNISQIKAKKIRLNKLSCLNRFCRSQQMAGIADKAKALRDELNKEGVILGPMLTENLITLASFNDDLEDALKLKIELSEYPGYLESSQFPLVLCRMLVEARRYEEAITELVTYNAKTSSVNKSMRKHRRKHWDTDVLSHDILLASKKYLDNIQTYALFNALVAAGFCTGKSHQLDVLMQTYIDENDLLGAIGILEMCVDQYQKCPSYSALMQKIVLTWGSFFANKYLKQIIAEVLPLENKATVLTNFLMALIQNGKIRIAWKLLHNPSFDFDLQKEVVKSHIEEWILLQNVKAVQDFVKVTKKVPSIDRADAIFSLIRVYAEAIDTPSAGDAALEAFLLYEEEGVEPGTHVFNYLADVRTSSGSRVSYEKATK